GESTLLLAEAARRLARFPGPGAEGGYPLLDFFRRLEGEARDEERGLLRIWIDEASDLLAVPRRPAPAAPPAAAATAAPRTSGAEEAECHLVVRFDPSSQATEEYLVRAWLYQGPTHAELPLEKEPWTRRNRAGMLGKLWREATGRVDPGRRLV